MSPSFTAGEPCWIELFTPDAEAAADFYGTLFGWTAGEASPEFGGYRMLLRDGEPVAGLMPNDASSGTPSTWSVYLATDDIEATTQRAKDAGATVVAEPMEIADLGSRAVLVDPAGALIGAWQARTFPGFAARAEDGAPAWFETLSTDYPRSVAFYTDVFGWDVTTMGDTPEFRYSTLGKDDDARAGIMDGSGFLGEESSRWQFYVQVADTDATVERALAGGATLQMPVDDSLYGRLGALQDPAGIPFCLMGPNSQAG
jgi:predicted enzyme related to lactoylglutathione lyase